MHGRKALTDWLRGSSTATGMCGHHCPGFDLRDAGAGEERETTPTRDYRMPSWLFERSCTSPTRASRVTCSIKRDAS